MKQATDLTLEMRAKMAVIRDLLTERYVEQKEALESGDRAHAIELQFEIKELLRDEERIKGRWLSDPAVRRDQT